MKITQNKSTQFFLIASLFVLSGIAALMYQIVWFKHLSYFLGNTTYSQSIVLATFMGGLAIGSWWWGKKADESKNALKLFAWLEVGIAVYCFLYFPIFEFVKDGFVGLVVSQQWSSDSTTVLVLKLLVSVFTMLVPTILMGGTLPVLVRYLSDHLQDVGKNVSILYFINSLGAVIGTIVAGFYLLQTIGLRATVYTAATADLLVGVVFLYVAYKVSPHVFRSKQKRKEKQKTKDKIYNDSFIITPKQYKIVLIIAAVSGLCAMMYEIVWLRLLIPILSSTTYSFTLILAVFITGITLGSLLIYILLPRLKKPFVFLGFCQLAIVLSILLTLPFYEKIPYLIWSAVGDNMATDEGYQFYLKTQFYYCFLVMIVPTIFMGMSLPIASRLAVKKISQTGSSVGKIFAINTIGTVVGSLLAGLLLIPIIGIKNTLEIALLLNLLVGFLVLFQPNILSKTIISILIFAILLGTVYYFQNVNYDRWTYSIMTSEIGRKINRKKAPKNFDGFIKEQKRINEKILYYKEGISGTIVVGSRDDQTFLYTNGKGDANSKGDLQTQIFLAQIPMILHPSPDSVFVIGCGSGTTIGNVLTHKNVNYAGLAEISPEVLEAANYFNEVNNTPFLDNRLNIIKDDGLSALRLSNQKYDVIISQPSNPWSAGVGNLFTKEFFRDCKKKLKKNGLLAQWTNLYEMNDELFKIVLNTLFDEFEFITFWQIGRSDVLFLCSNEDFNIDFKIVEKKYDQVKEFIEKFNYKGIETLFAKEIVVDEKDMQNYLFKNNLMNTENKPILEFLAPKSFFMYSFPREFIILDKRKETLNQNSGLLKKYHNYKNGLSDENIFNIAKYHEFVGNHSIAEEFGSHNYQILINLANKETKNKNFNKALVLLDKAERISKFNSKVVLQKAELLILLNKTEKAVETINKGLEYNPVFAEFYFVKGQIFSNSNELNEALINYEKAISLDESFVKAYVLSASIFVNIGEIKKAVNILSKAIDNGNKQPEIFFNRGAAKLMNNDPENSISDFTDAINLKPEYAIAYFYRGKAYEKMNNKILACNDYAKAANLGLSEATRILKELCVGK